jgi:hypothetical protein
MTDTIVYTKESLSQEIHASLTIFSHRELASNIEVQDMLLDLRNAANKAGLVSVVEKIDKTNKVWPRSQLVACSEVIDFLLDVESCYKA